MERDELVQALRDFADAVERGDEAEGEIEIDGSRDYWIPIFREAADRLTELGRLEIP